MTSNETIEELKGKQFVCLFAWISINSILIPYSIMSTYHHSNGVSLFVSFATDMIYNNTDLPQTWRLQYILCFKVSNRAYISSLSEK